MRITLGLAVGWLLVGTGTAPAQFAGYGFQIGGRNWVVTGFTGGYGGWGPGYYGPWAPPVVVAPPTVVVVRTPPATHRDTLLGRLPNLTPEPVPDRWPGAADRVDRQVKRGDLLVIRPRGAGVVQPPRPEPFPPAIPKEARPAIELARAREAFAAGLYGLAAERLAAAIAADPAAPLPYFLLAQARTARGDYADAVAAIRDGLDRAPDWPAATVNLREVYGPAAARFDEHLAELRRAAAADPADPTVGFLLGYHLWFLGQKADAVKLFRRAKRQVKDATVIERFLVEADVKS